MTPTSPNPRNERGLSLVELMIVLVFIALGILALSSVQTRSFTDVYASGRSSRALDLAKVGIENARAAGFDNAVSDSGISGPFTWNTRVDTVNAGLRRVTSRVTWVETNDSTRTVSLVDLISTR